MKLQELTEGWHTRSAEEAVSEVQRELQVRQRCFVRWIEDGRISAVDAKDRIQRIMKAIALLNSQSERDAAFSESAATGPSIEHAKDDKTNVKKSEKCVDDVPF